MPTRNDAYDDFMRDLDETSRLSDDPFELSTEIGALDDDDLELLIGAPRRTPAKKPAAAPAKPARKRTAKKS